MAITNVTLFSSQIGWEGGGGAETKASSDQTGGLGKYIRNLYVDFDPGSGVSVTVTLNFRVTDPVDGSTIYLVSQAAPGTNSTVFAGYSLGAQLKKWVAVGVDPTAPNNNGFLMLPSDTWSVEMTLGGTPAADTTITLIAQLDDGLG